MNLNFTSIRGTKRADEIVAGDIIVGPSINDGRVLKTMRLNGWVLVYFVNPYDVGVYFEYHPADTVTVHLGYETH